jgi:HD-like signal output (HDOD) protein
VNKTVSSAASSSPSPLSLIQSLPQDEAVRVRRVLEGGIKLPAQPRVLEDMRQLMARQEMDVRLLARTIAKDPGLVALLFKVVASPAYRQHHPLNSLEQVLHAVGVQQTFHLVQALSLISAATPHQDRRLLESFWARSRMVGQLAMLVADERITVCNIFPDQAYLAGIFHACGVPLLMQRFPTYCHEMRLGIPGQWPHWADEDGKFNTDHCVVGYLVARHWCLPDFIADAIRFQASLHDLGDHAVSSMIAILQLAIDIRARDQRLPNSDWERLQAPVLQELGLDESTLPEFIDIVLERFHAES